MLSIATDKIKYIYTDDYYEIIKTSHLIFNKDDDNLY